MLTTKEVLSLAYQLLEKPECWTKGCMARNIEDRKVSITHPHACKFSLEGAIYRIALITKTKVFDAHQLVKGGISKGMTIPIAHFNDANGTTHSAMLAILRKAIERASDLPQNGPGH